MVIQGLICGVLSTCAYLGRRMVAGVVPRWCVNGLGCGCPIREGKGWKGGGQLGISCFSLSFPGVGI